MLVEKAVTSSSRSIPRSKATEPFSPVTDSSVGRLLVTGERAVAKIAARARARARLHGRAAFSFGFIALFRQRDPQRCKARKL